MDQYFSNKSQRGAFGEFAYATFCNQKGFGIERTNFCNTDYILKSQTDARYWYVDVKTIASGKEKYLGKRFHEEIIYESIFSRGDDVYLTPDIQSPFNSKNPILIGKIQDLLNSWENREPDKNTRTKKTDRPWLMRIVELFKKSPYKRVRFVERGDASKNRWSGTVDNLPGSDKVLLENDATIFIQYKCDNFEERIELILFLSHELIAKKIFKMTTPDVRQKSKKIENLLDIKDFISTKPQFVFKNIDQLEIFVNSISN